MTGRLLCWILRRLGYPHAFKRVTVNRAQSRVCVRCGASVPVNHRAPKPVSQPLFNEE